MLIIAAHHQRFNQNLWKGLQWNSRMTICMNGGSSLKAPKRLSSIICKILKTNLIASLVICYVFSFTGVSEGGIFQLLMKFPNDYPMSPPVVTFASEFWHPNGMFVMSYY